jgi:hypothetical protein
MRSTGDVFHDHLRLRAAGEAEADIEQNYAEDVVIIDRYEVRRGRDGAHDAAACLADELPDAEFEYVTTHVADDYAYLEWQAKADGARVCHGADSFVIRDGLIQAQTIYYRVHEL